MHLNAYTVEQTFRFNERKDIDGAASAGCSALSSASASTTKSLPAMSPPPHEEVNAKVERRDPPETAKKTMAPLRALLKVPMSEVAEQQRLYDMDRTESDNKPPRRVRLLASLSAPTTQAEDADAQKRMTNASAAHPRLIVKLR